MTIDTERGPVDLVAVIRALHGEPMPLTTADVAYAASLLPSGYGPQVKDAAAGLGIVEASVRRIRDRRNAADKKDRTRP